MRLSHLAAGCFLAVSSPEQSLARASNSQEAQTTPATSRRAPAPTSASAPLPRLSAATNRKAARRVAQLMEDRYVFPEAGKRAAAVVRAATKRGAYDALNTDELLANALATDLRRVINDGHLNVFVDRSLAESILRPPSQVGADDEAVADEAGRRGNYGLRRAEVLAGNVGYLEVREFAAPSAQLERAYGAALTLLQNTDAILIDLRQNGGGHGSSATLLAATFFAQATRFVDTYDRPTNRRTEGWTPGVIPWLRRPSVPLYILTSKATYSAAEAIAYGLQANGRATIVGEATGGGAHPTEYKAISGSIILALPESRSEHPVTRQNWQQVGVQPGVVVVADAARERAHLMALVALQGAATNPLRQEALAWDIEYARSRTSPAAVTAAALKRLVGRYGLRTLSYEASALSNEPGTLYYQLEGRPRFPLVPVEAEGDRIRFVLAEDDRVEITQLSGSTLQMRKYDRSGQGVTALRSPPAS